MWILKEHLKPRLIVILIPLAYGLLFTLGAVVHGMVDAASVSMTMTMTTIMVNIIKLTANIFLICPI